mmetsp:Transcript_19691/g.49671  ORF Transcript_19691/g.49671 Transcript_19691/m.49671 type:complete len:176 (-) Transcript_19691:32-559(-)
MCRAGSVGLGGNISRSLRTMRAGDEVTPCFNAEGDDAGNGSLMRLASIPIAYQYRLDARAAASAAAESSYTTHPGPIAAEACAFLATLCVRAMAEFEPAQQARESARAFLIRVSPTSTPPPSWRRPRRRRRRGAARRSCAGCCSRPSRRAGFISRSGRKVGNLLPAFDCFLYGCT